jgi:hypothetical protein
MQPQRVSSLEALAGLGLAVREQQRYPLPLRRLLVSRPLVAEALDI